MDSERGMTVSYYDDEFYCEPGEFDAQVDEFKQAILKSVKEEFVAEMGRLKKENFELQEFKKHKQKFESEITKIKHQAQIDKEEAFRQAKRARLSELLGGFEFEMWTPEYYYMETRKCNKCDNDRKIQYKTPLGKDAYESCDCSGKIKVYHPAKNTLHKISTQYDWSSIKNKWIYYSLKSDGDYDSAEFRSDDSAKNLFITGVTTFEEVEKNFYRRFYFENYDDCHRFCMWMMKKDAGLLPDIGS